MFIMNIIIYINTTVFEKMSIFYYRFVVNFSVYSLDAFLAQKNMI
jgi:hypothetical protein